MSLVSRRPAWPGAGPPLAPRFDHSLAESSARWLVETVLQPIYGLDACEIRAMRPEASGTIPRDGHYKVLDSSGRQFLLRIRRCGDRAAHLTACRVADHLHRVTAPVISPIRPANGWSATALGDLVVLLVPFVDARHTDHSTRDCHELGKALGRMHEALACYAETADVAARTAEFDARLVEERRAVLSGEVGHLPATLQQVTTAAAQLYQPSFWATAPHCCHGDMTPGNVLFDHDGRAVILDFEDAAFAYRSSVFDIASALLRFAVPDRDGFTERRHALLQGYESVRALGVDAAALDRSMAMLVAHNIFVLSAANREQPGAALPDWKKFLPMWDFGLIRAQRAT